MAILWRLPVEASAYFYPGLVLATFYTYNFIGVRFPNALAVDIAVLLAYNVIFGYLKGYPVPMLLSHNFFIISANLIGGGAGYLAELQRRQLYLREVEIDLERKHHLERSLHDRLTGLPNRELLEDRISQLLARARRDSACHAGFFVDLDGFKAINDTLGHDHGDAVLRAVAERMKAMARQTDTVSRIGGDEFFVLAHDVGTREAAAQMAEKLLDCVVGATPAGARGSRLGASIGICRFCGGGAGPQDAGQIIRDADQAMYAAKAGGKNRHAFAAGSPAWP